MYVFGGEIIKQNLTRALVITFVSLVWGASGLTVCAESGPRLVIPQAEFDFGSVSQGQKVEHEFLVRNDGDQDLIIQRISPSCGCTAAAMSSGAVKPGTSEKIKVAFNTAGFYGTKTKSVSVLTNARDNPEFVLKMKGNIVRGVTVTPERVELGDVAPGASQPMRTKEFTVELNEGSDREISAVTTSSKYLTVIPLGSQGRTKRYSVTLASDAPRGEFRDRVVVEFKKQEHTAVNIPVIASVSGDVRVIPSTVSFGIIDGKQPIERRIRFENGSTGSVSIVSVTSGHPAVTASVVNVEAGKRGVIVLTLDPTKVTTDLRSTIEIKTDHPEESVIAVGIFGVQAPK